MLKLTVLTLAVLLSACAADRGSSAGLAAANLPPSQATPDEQKLIDTTLNQIEGTAADIGHPHGFHQIPVVVNDDGQVTKQPAACIKENGRYILLTHDVLQREAKLDPKNSEVSLFRVLLHEIGHCYFDREHESAPLESPGKMISLTGDAGTQTYLALDATVMAPNVYTMPKALEKYYVAELMGYTRAKTVADLAPYAKASEVAVAAAPTSAAVSSR